MFASIPSRALARLRSTAIACGLLALHGCAPARAPATIAASSAPVGEPPTFAAYEVEMMRSAPAPLDLAGFRGGEHLVERFTSEAGEPPNFSGSYRIVSWSCGTHCSTGVVLDLRDGSIHTLPTMELGMAYRPDSALFIVNPRPEALFAPGEIPGWAMTHYLYWDGDQFHLLGPMFTTARHQRE